MRKIILLLGCAMLFVTLRAGAQNRGFGVGFVAGEQTGISTKIWTTQTNAVQFSLAWRNENEFLGSRVSVSGDYLWHSFDAIQSSYLFPVYYGVGGALISGGAERDIIGVRGIAGIEYLPRKVPLDLFLQVVPMLVLTPGTSLEVGAGVGLRFFFR